MSYAEFMVLSEYLKSKHTRPELEHYYLAQIAREIRTVLYKASDAKKFKIDDFLISFVEKVKSNLPQKSTQQVEVQKGTDVGIPDMDEVRRRTKISQSMWFGMLGLGKDGVKKEEPSSGKKNSPRRTGSSSNRKR